ncbi:MAG: AAA family ATPase [Prevotellaceae bacterium]|jgi:HTH-type transcriptional repressor of NAD biosynthesis genes|nr:AAA family ATPase [Prevotellaceae bacterium]
MVKAFTFGKFLPFHKGHEALIRFALSKCDFLSVLICRGDNEKISGETRREWIESCFGNIPGLTINIFDYNESELPRTSVASREVSGLWAEKFKTLFPDCRFVITSEPYGYFVAEYMNIEHIMFDVRRALFPVSATAIRSDWLACRDFMPESVRRYFMRKVVVSGTESTGKTTLTQRLALHYGCVCVPEAGRDIISNSKSFSYDDLHIVAREHARRILEAERSAAPLVVIDTDIHITKSYARFMFQKDLPASRQICDANRAHLYLYLKNDLEYVQDGTRLDRKERDMLDECHRKTLEAHSIPFVEIGGRDPQARFEAAVREIDELLRKSVVARLMNG